MLCAPLVAHTQVIVHSTYFDLLKSPCGSAKMKSSLFYLEMTYYAHAVAAHINLRQISGVPHYVYTYGAAWFYKILESMLIIIIAPMVYLDQNELYLPSDLQAHLDNTYPAFNYAVINNGPSSFDLSNLDQLNTVGNCSVTDFDACPIYLTSKGNVTANPQWLYGVLPDPETHKTQGVKSCAVIVNDRGSGIVDAFYMYFYAFNLGNTVYGQNLGNHVGDWEHSMLRFEDGKPSAMWFSQHDVSQRPSPKLQLKHRYVLDLVHVIMCNRVARLSRMRLSLKLALVPLFTVRLELMPTTPYGEPIPGSSHLLLSMILLPQGFSGTRFFLHTLIL